MPIFTIFFTSFLIRGFTIILSKFGTWQGGSFGWNIIYFTTFLCFLPYYNNTPYLCFLHLLMISICWPNFKHGTHISTFTSGACNIRTFHSLSEMCSLVSIGIRPIHVTSTKLFYTQHMFSYFRCTSGFYGICGILCCRGVLEGF